MNLLGFNLTKISIEKISDKVKDIKIKTNIDIIDILEGKNDIFKSEDSILAIKFEYVVDYSPDFAKLNFNGNIIIAVPKGEAKEVMDKWKDKKLIPDMKMAMFNLILTKCNIKAFQLEEELGLPLHMPLFKLKKSDSE